MASLLSFLRAGPPPPRVALLPDSAFFTRSIPVPEGANPLEVAAAVELGLEAASPFPLAQLYHGWYWRPGSPHALAFAAYRRRFAADEAATWADAELVLPAFATTLGQTPAAGTTVLLPGKDELTALLWSAGSVPARVLTRPLPPEADDDLRAGAQAALLGELGATGPVITLPSVPVPLPAMRDREVAFQSGDFAARLDAAATVTIDVRDKADLAALRRGRRRDVGLWRTFTSLAAALVLLGLGELALAGGGVWQRARAQQWAAQKPLVDRISGVHELTRKIEELATKRLQPLEMMTQLTGVDLERKPPEIQFTRIQADQSKGLYTLFVEGKTTNPAKVSEYEAALRQLPAIAKVEAPISQVKGDQAQFTLTAVFKPEALLPKEESAPAAK
ncbi:MAG: hypothetical protein ACO3G4_08565 [Opitutaceae bacterium]